MQIRQAASRGMIGKLAAAIVSNLDPIHRDEPEVTRSIKGFRDLRRRIAFGRPGLLRFQAQLAKRIVRTKPASGSTRTAAGDIAICFDSVGVC